MVTIAQALELAARHSHAGRLAMAEQLCRQILQVDARNVGALHLLGILALQVGRNDLAIEYFSQTLQLKPDFAEAHSNLGMVLARQGSCRRQWPATSKPCASSPTSRKPTITWRMPSGSKGNWRRPWPATSRLAAQTGLCRSELNLGVALLEQGNLTEAVACYQQALRSQTRPCRSA